MKKLSMIIFISILIITGCSNQSNAANEKKQNTSTESSKEDSKKTNLELEIDKKLNLNTKGIDQNESILGSYYDYPKESETLYINNYFGIALIFPKEWLIFRSYSESTNDKLDMSHDIDHFKTTYEWFPSDKFIENSYQHSILEASDQENFYNFTVSFLKSQFKDEYGYSYSNDPLSVIEDKVHMHVLTDKYYQETENFIPSTIGEVETSILDNVTLYSAGVVSNEVNEEGEIVMSYYKYLVYEYNDYIISMDLILIDSENVDTEQLMDNLVSKIQFRTK